jgi:hypothetical protein
MKGRLKRQIYLFSIYSACLKMILNNRIIGKVVLLKSVEISPLDLG